MMMIIIITLSLALSVYLSYENPRTSTLGHHFSSCPTYREKEQWDDGQKIPWRMLYIHNRDYVWCCPLHFFTLPQLRPVWGGFNASAASNYEAVFLPDSPPELNSSNVKMNFGGGGGGYDKKNTISLWHWGKMWLANILFKTLRRGNEIQQMLLRGPLHREFVCDA